MRVLGIDLAWATNKKSGVSNETGVVAVESDGTVVDAGWTRGLAETLDWIAANAGPDTFAMIDAPLVVTNAVGQRACERQTGQRKPKAIATSGLAGRGPGGAKAEFSTLEALAAAVTPPARRWCRGRRPVVVGKITIQRVPRYGA